LEWDFTPRNLERLYSEWVNLIKKEGT